MAVQGGNALGGPGEPRVRFEVIGDAWRLFSQQSSTWVVAMLVFLIVMVGVVAVSSVILGAVGLGMANMGRSADPSAAGIGFLASMFAMLPITLIIILAMMILSGGLYRMALKQIRGQEIAIGDMFTVTDVLPALVVASLVVAVAVGIGNMFCWIPGIIAGGLLMFAVPLAVDYRGSGMEAVSGSFSALSGQWLMATLFYLVVTIIGSIGGLACGVGLLVTMPLMFLSIALLYNDFFPPEVMSAPIADPLPPGPQM